MKGWTIKTMPNYADAVNKWWLVDDEFRGYTILLFIRYCTRIHELGNSLNQDKETTEGFDWVN